MENSKEVKLKSGNVLRITPSSFADAKALFQSCFGEMKVLKFDLNQEIDVNLFKDAFCTALSSKEIEAGIWVCLKRCLYNDKRVTPDTFEPVAAREDYLEICMEVAKENVLPFLKGLSVGLPPVLENLLKGQT